MRTSIIIFFTALTVSSFAQLSKQQWLIGGNGNFSYSKSKELKFTSAQLSPAAGYFLVDKLAGGLRLGFTSDTYKYESEKFQNSTLSVSPFLRYYFLPSKQKVNLLADASFGYSWTKQKAFPPIHKYTYSQFAIMAGPAIFLNERTALEITAGYTFLSRGPVDSTITSKIQIGVGLQIHLGKL